MLSIVNRRLIRPSNAASWDTLQKYMASYLLFTNGGQFRSDVMGGPDVDGKGKVVVVWVKLLDNVVVEFIVT